MSTLYLVGTPIGNLEDITPRALQVLREVSLIAAEDTRTAKQLLAHFEIHTSVTSYYEHNKLTKLDRILKALLGGDVAVISEAGMPGLSDPGYELVRAALARDIPVVPVPGPSAILAALVGSGLSAERFYYLGFLPREPQKRRRLLREVAQEPTTLIAFEAPHRIRETLADMEAILDGREICVARELTKVFEEFRRGPISEVRKHFDENEPRGEFTLIVEGAATRRGRAAAPEEWDEERVRSEVRKLLRKGVPRPEAVKRVARASRRDRREVYQLTLKESE
ncbi:MAG: 16S rRNA (cytidine(1402)-2'-O)-methyltransferase [Anaerolineae bacterium]